MSDSKYADSDIVLLAAMRQGDTKAYDALFKKYYPVLCVYCYRLVEAEAVEDVVQEIMMWLWEKREEIQLKTSLNSYLYRMVCNRCLNYNARNEMKLRVELFFQQRLAEDVKLIETDTLKDLMKRTNEAIDKLPSAYKEAFCMHRLQGMSYKEIAEELQVSPKTVDYRIQQALKLLRSWLKGAVAYLLPLIG